MPSIVVNLSVTTTNDIKPQQLEVTLDEQGVLSQEILHAALEKASIKEEQILKVVIPDGVTSIGEAAFYCCTSLTSINIPDSVTSISEGAFECCTSLTEIIIPDKVKSIDYMVFSGCKSLTTLTIPDSVTSIGEGAFCRCTSLTSITILGSVESIGNGAFAGCDALKIVFFANEALAEAVKRSPDNYFGQEQDNKPRVIAHSDLETWVKTQVENVTWKEQIAASYGKLSFEKQVILYKLSPEYNFEPNEKPSIFLKAFQMLLSGAIPSELSKLILDLMDQSAYSKTAAKYRKLRSEPMSIGAMQFLTPKDFFSLSAVSKNNFSLFANPLEEGSPSSNRPQRLKKRKLENCMAN